ncbi:MAG: phage tail sheath family protein [Lachnospiraceae bacterium]|nr:phage tail sheath family protein [Lachnospiraceae bacterium]
MSDYLYGTYGHLGETVAQNADTADTVVVAIGMAPVNLVAGYKTAGIINKPVKLQNLSDAQRTMGYSSDWSKFTLCETMAAHFDNAEGNIGPVYVINVLNPEVHKTATKTTEAITFTNGRGSIKSDIIILDSLVLEDKVEGTDYTKSYDFSNGKVIIASLDTEDPITGSISASYDTIDISAVTATTIAGTQADGVYTGIQAIKLLYSTYNVITNLIVAPGWSDKPDVYKAIAKVRQQINGHWDAIGLTDLPISATTILAAKTFKTEDAYSDEGCKSFWPQAVDASGKIFHLSSLAAVEFMRADAAHDGVPMETCGNKSIPVVKQYFGALATNQGFDQLEAKELAKNGIATCVFWGGNWVLWGDSTDAYTFGAEAQDARNTFDTSMRMMYYITNSFQKEWGNIIDKPFTKQLKDTIINREQEKLDGLVAVGALIGHPSVSFIEDKNPLTSIKNGDFRWDIPVTPVVPLKSASVYVAYTDAGFSAYFE